MRSGYCADVNDCRPRTLREYALFDLATRRRVVRRNAEPQFAGGIKLILCTDLSARGMVLDRLATMQRDEYISFSSLCHTKQLCETGVIHPISGHVSPCFVSFHYLSRATSLARRLVHCPERTDSGAWSAAYLFM